MKSLIGYALFFIYYSPVAAQLGCIDPLALNYNPQATANDGSCAYPVTEYSLTELTLLPELLHEASGLEWLNNGLFIHNDAGNPDKLYRIDSLNGEIIQTITIAGAENFDWEDMAEDEDFIYVGDIGNNIGNRTDLRIYKIQKSDLSANVVNAEIIEFSFEDQVDFEPGMNDHDFDCEAMIAFGDSLHLFTKNWVDNQTRHYVLDNTPGNQVARYVEMLDVGGLVTGADISTNNTLVLVGYTEFGLNFMWLLYDYQEHRFFSGNKRRIALGSGLENGQTEGITFRDSNYGYICSEKITVNSNLVLPQKILSFSVDQWINPAITSFSNLPIDDNIKVYPNPCDSFVQIETPFTVDQWQLIGPSGNLIKIGSADAIQQFKFNTSGWHSGQYYLVFLSKGRQFVTGINKR